VVEITDRDSMIYSDGAASTSKLWTTKLVCAILSGTYAMDEANYLFFGKSYNTDLDPDTRYIKMQSDANCFDNCSCCYESC
jgi:3-oxoacyl-[acyl-carrier-protein] synthase-3